MTYAAGDVIGFYSEVASKHKFHLCVGGCHFLLLNSPKTRQFPGDLVVRCSEIPCLEPTATGKSVVSCSMVVTMTESELVHCRASKKGVAEVSLLPDLAKFIEASPVLSQDDKDKVLDGLAAYRK